ncbi:eukaryotic translation initiation factor 2 subunit alpha [Suillus bovinus]|uniref:eukaryotic translation initiation factor 2 subunit alpha n=1 Tax=Suillus bovinus TaxID=48563 RepID=UPI001B87E8F1|nr:eukaryotic translation initiation factor 2 subunit alpha [Suillus bovinus]KAG2159253.1 eukaryotic translation initiation factor 2 subunit alpha [Suillus bovinus]
MRYYEQRYPEVDELVMVQVRQIAEMGAYVKLLEYDNIEGMILLSELSRRRIRSIQKLIRVGRNEVVVVLRVDREKGYIDLSKRRVSPEDIIKCEERYMKSKAVASIMRHVASKLPSMDADAAISPEDEAVEKETKKVRRAAKKDNPEEAAAAIAAEEAAAVPHDGSNEEERLEKLYEQVAWPLGHKYGHTYDAFKLALTCAPDIELTCYTPAGIDAIKKALRAGEAQSNETVPIKAKLVAPPLYVLSTNATDKYAAVDRLERAIESILSTIEGQGGNLVVKMKPKAVSETEEQDLAQLMAKAGQENAEVSGDEDDEEGVQ